MQEAKSILLFDGVCNLCNGFVNFIIDHDPDSKFRFASLQSETGKKILAKYELLEEEFESFILIKENKVYTKSTAALLVAKELKGGIWKWLYFLKAVPEPICDSVYTFVAKNRFK